MTTQFPSAEAFRRAGWLPASEEHRHQWLHRLHKDVEDNSKKLRSRLETYDGQVEPLPEPLNPKVEALLNFIERDVTIHSEFIRMFKWAKNPPYDYHELIGMYNRVIKQAPTFGSLGPPMYMVMADAINSQGGFSVFLKQELNKHFKEIMGEWSDFLASSKSLYVLDPKKEDGWLHSKALGELMRSYGGANFADVFECDSSLDYYGFKSYDEFFNRDYNPKNVGKFRPITSASDIINMPIPNPPISTSLTSDNTHIQDKQIISAPCESTVFALRYDVKAADNTPLFIKGEVYSLRHLLNNNDHYVNQFVGGTVFQTFLNTTDYHRWHAPIDGVIEHIEEVPGTYFAQAPELIDTDRLPFTHPDPAPPYLRSLSYFAHLATRSIIYIKADNKAIGTLCFIGIGMTEISTCHVTVKVGDRVKRGVTELGMFHFGGSSSAMVFKKSSNFRAYNDFANPGVHVPIHNIVGIVDA